MTTAAAPEASRHGLRLVPFLRRMLEIGSLDRGIQALAGLALLVILLTALLLIVASGGNLPRVEVLEFYGKAISMPLPLYWLVVAVLSLGWGYVLASIVGSSNRLRWPALVLFTIAILEPDASVLGSAGNPFAALVLLGPELALLIPAWTLAATYAIAGWRGVNPVTVAITTGSVLTFFGSYQLVEQLVGLSGSGSVVEFMMVSQIVVLPLYLLAGVDLSELLFMSGGQAWSWSTPRLGPRAPLVLALTVSAAALVAELALNRGVFLAPGRLVYALAWMCVASIFLLFVIPRQRIADPPSYFVVFVVVVIGFLGAGGWLGVPVLPRGQSLSLSLIGAACLLVAAALRLRGGVTPVPTILLLGLMGIWLLFFNVPEAILLRTYVQVDLLGSTALVSAFALVGVAVAAERCPVLRVLRTALTLETLAVGLMWIFYVVVLLKSTDLQDVLPALQVAAFLLALAFLLESIPLQLRVIGVAVALIVLLGLVAVSLVGGPLALVTIANATLLAVAVVWEVLMSGRRVTNRRGSFWPREARVIGFLGYALIGLGLATFFDTASGVGLVLNNFPAAGLVYFGTPVVLYMLRAGWVPDRQAIDLTVEF